MGGSLPFSQKFIDPLRGLMHIASETRRYAKVALTLQRPEDKPMDQRLHAYMMEWAALMLSILKVRVTSRGTPLRHAPVILVGNHSSYLDIPLLMSLTPTVFVAKKQVSSWIVFGKGCRILGTILVDRDSKGSRKTAADQIAPSVIQRNQSVVIFPSGTTSIDESEPWRWGPFRIAFENKIPIQPFRIRYRPAERAAYLMKDAFFIHLWGLLRSDGLDVSVEFHDPVMVTDPERDCVKWREWSREGL